MYQYVKLAVIDSETTFKMFDTWILIFDCAFCAYFMILPQEQCTS